MPANPTLKRWAIFICPSGTLKPKTEFEADLTSGLGNFFAREPNAEALDYFHLSLRDVKAEDRVRGRSDFGTWDFFARDPDAKRWAIFICPSGTLKPVAKLHSDLAAGVLVARIVGRIIAGLVKDRRRGALQEGTRQPDVEVSVMILAIDRQTRFG